MMHDLLVQLATSLAGRTFVDAAGGGVAFLFIFGHELELTGHANMIFAGGHVDNAQNLAFVNPLELAFRSPYRRRLLLARVRDGLKVDLAFIRAKQLRDRIVMREQA